MSQHLRTRKIVDAVISQLLSGTHIVLSKKRLNLYPYLPKLLRDSLPQQKQQQLSRAVLRYMRQQNLISLQEYPRGQWRLRINEAGITRGHKITLRELQIPRPSRWDRKWRLVFFDIPETKRLQRNQLVAKLKDLGFYQLQKSMWLHPYPCRIEIEYLKKVYGLGPYVFLAEVSRIDQHNRLLYRFRGLVPQRRMS